MCVGGAHAWYIKADINGVQTYSDVVHDYYIFRDNLFLCGHCEVLVK